MKKKEKQNTAFGSRRPLPRQSPFDTSPSQQAQTEIKSYKSQPVNMRTKIYCSVLLASFVPVILLTLSLPPIEWTFIIVLLPASVVAAIFLWGNVDKAKFTFCEDGLHIKAIRGLHVKTDRASILHPDTCQRKLSIVDRVDVTIPYKDLLLANNYQEVPHRNYYREIHEKPHERILFRYWNNVQAGSIDVVAPAKAQDFIEGLNAAAGERDFSHIINPKYLSKTNCSVVVPIEECDFLDHNQLAEDSLFALLQHGEKVILLRSVGVSEEEKIINADPPEVQVEAKVHCVIGDVMHLVNYKTVEEAVQDTAYYKPLDATFRAVDIICADPEFQP